MYQGTIEKHNVKSIDFNCDLAQSFGVYKNNAEYELLDYVSSVNISCGFHAGDPLSIKNALLAAKERNLVIGAHIGFDDIQGFGYRNMDLREDEIEALVIYQVGALMSFAKSYNLEIEHVRPHGAMYKQASEDFQFACSIAKAIKKCSQWLVYYGAAGDVTQKVGEFLEIPIAQELHLNKVYNEDLTIDYSAPERNDAEYAIRRLQNFLHSSQVNNNQNGMSYIPANTIHLSNKYASSIEIAQRAYSAIVPEPVNFIKAKSSGWVG